MIKKADVSSVSITDKWAFKLFVCGENQRAVNAYCNLKKALDKSLGEKYVIEIIDLTKNPQMASSHNITACPTVIKESPSPKRVVIGDLSRTEVVFAKLDLPIACPIADLTKVAKTVSLSNFYPEPYDGHSGNLITLEEADFMFPTVFPQ